MSKSQSIPRRSEQSRMGHPLPDHTGPGVPPDSLERTAAYAAAFEHAAIGMALVGVDGQLLGANRALCQILGYERHELLTLGFGAGPSGR